LHQNLFLAIALADIAQVKEGNLLRRLKQVFSSIAQEKDILCTSSLLGKNAGFKEPCKIMSGKICDAGVRKQINYLCLEELILV